MEDQLLRVREFCDIYAVSRATFYRHVYSGALRTLKIGTARRVRRSDAEAWLDRMNDKPDSTVS